MVCERVLEVVVNGRVVQIDREITLSDFLRERGWDEALVAVEHNLSWLRREDWPEVAIRDGDRLEVVRIMAGG